MEYATEKNYTDDAMMAIDNLTTLSASVRLQKLGLINLKETIKHASVLAFYVFIMIVGLIGNSFVLYIYKVKIKRFSARTYILFLALMDFLVCCVGLPYHTLDLTHLVTYYHADVCRTLSYLSGAVNIGSVFVLMVVAVDRYLRVCRSLKKQLIDFGDRKACVIAIASAIVISIPNVILYGSSTVVKNTDGHTLEGVECFIDDDYAETPLAVGYLSFYILIFIICVFTLIVLYTLVGMKIYKNQAFKPMQCSRAEGCRTCISANSNDSDTDSVHSREGTKLMTLTTTCKIVSEDDRLAVEPMDTIKEEQQIETHVKSDKETNVTKSVTDAGNVAVSESLIQQPVVVKPLSARKIGSPVSNKRIINSQPAKDAKHKSVKPIKSNVLVRHTTQGSGEKHTRKITLMMFTITVLFILSYLPFIIISLLDSANSEYWKDMSSSMSVFADFMLRFYLINNMANAFIYSFWDERFRGECILIFEKILCCCRRCNKNKTSRK